MLSLTIDSKYGMFGVGVLWPADVPQADFRWFDMPESRPTELPVMS